jgi:hypothetical protein
MAAPITHIALTEKIFDKFFKNKKKKDFFIGTLFPDIQYLKVIDRNKTHYNNLVLNDLEKDNSFLTGVKFHSILDIAREKFIVANNVYSLCPESKYITQSLKLLEDEIFYQHIEDWNEYIDYLNEILPDEINFGVAKSDIKKWHLLLQQYFLKQPNKRSITDFILGIDFSQEAADKINIDIEKMRANKKIINIIKNLYKNFDLLLTKTKKIIKC